MDSGKHYCIRISTFNFQSSKQNFGKQKWRSVKTCSQTSYFEMALQRVSMLHFSLKQWGVRCCSCWRHLLVKVGRTTKRFFNFRHHDLWLACIVSKFFFFLSLIFWLMNNNHSKTIFRIKCKILYLAIITHSSDGLLRHYIVDKLRRLRSAKCFWIVSTKEKKTR